MNFLLNPNDVRYVELGIVPICKEIGNLFIKKARLYEIHIPYPILTRL